MVNRNRRFVRPGRLNFQPNITPLIDVLLVLIVIFMVIAPVVPTGLETQPTKQRQPSSMPKQIETALVLNLDNNRVITLNRMRLNSTGDVSDALRNVFKTRSDRTVFIQGSKTLAFDDIVQVIDAARGGGADRIGLMTEDVQF